MYVFASGQYSLPSFNWQQQASIFLPVSVQIRPDSDRCAELAGFFDRPCVEQTISVAEDVGNPREKGDPGWRLNPWGGTPPYGDQEEDQIYIKKGAAYAKCMSGRYSGS